MRLSRWKPVFEPPNQVTVDAKLFLISINKTFSWQYFSISDFKQLLNTFSLKTTNWKLMSKVRILHCVKYDSMDQETYDRLVDSVKLLVKTASPIPEKKKHVFTFDDFVPWTD